MGVVHFHDPTLIDRHLLLPVHQHGEHQIVGVFRNTGRTCQVARKSGTGGFTDTRLDIQHPLDLRTYTGDVQLVALGKTQGLHIAVHRGTGFGLCAHSHSIGNGH